MSIRLTEIEPKQTKGPKPKPYVRAKASPGGWVSIWAPTDIALVQQHGAGLYDGIVKEEGDFSNLSGLSLAAAEPEAPQSSSNGHPRSGDSGWRLPEQIIRTDALRLALDHMRVASDTSLGVITSWEVMALAAEFEAYITAGALPPRPQEPEPPPAETSVAAGPDDPEVPETAYQRVKGLILAAGTPAEVDEAGRGVGKLVSKAEMAGLVVLAHNRKAALAQSLGRPEEVPA